MSVSGDSGLAAVKPPNDTIRWILPVTFDGDRSYRGPKWTLFLTACLLSDKGVMTVFIPQTTPLDQSALRLVELDLKCTLPASFRAFVAKHDGAVPQENIFSTSDNQSGVSRFVPVFEAAKLRAGIEGFPDRAIPIAEDDCGNYVWLHTNTGEIFFWDHEIECDGQKIAESFDVFLSMLQPFDPASIKLQPGQVISVWIDPDFKPEFD